jgi:hypothetical protein
MRTLGINLIEGFYTLRVASVRKTLPAARNVKKPEGDVMPTFQSECAARGKYHPRDNALLTYETGGAI